jgi:phosphate transport system permease protein
MTLTLSEPTTAPPQVEPQTPPVHTSDTGRPADVPRVLNGRTRDEWVSFLGSALSSLALSWLVFFHVLPWSGLIGFVMTWWLTFVAAYAGVTALGNPRPVVVERTVSAVVHSVAALVGIALASTVLFIFIKGWPAVHHLNFFTEDMAGVRPTDPCAPSSRR